MLAAQERWYAAVFLLIWGSLVATVDNVLRPMLVAGRAQVGTLTVFIGVLGGVSAFGPIGVSGRWCSRSSSRSSALRSTSV